MKYSWQTLPDKVKRFLLVSVIIFTGWKLLFHLWLQPTQLLDRPLVNAIAAHSTWVLNIIHEENAYSYQTYARKHSLPGKKDIQYTGSVAWIFYKGVSDLFIVPNCDGLELMVLFAGFIIAYPGPTRKKIWVIPSGILAIHVVNVLRCVALIRLANSDFKKFFSFAHHYLFTITIYLFIFLLWVWYVNSLSKKPVSHVSKT